MFTEDTIRFSLPLFSVIFISGLKYLFLLLEMRNDFELTMLILYVKHTKGSFSSKNFEIS